MPIRQQHVHTVTTKVLLSFGQARLGGTGGLREGCRQGRRGFSQRKEGESHAQMVPLEVSQC